MKIKKKHFVLGAMLTTCSLAIVTSITSTFAWYSYNTKNGMAFQGIATGETESLQVRIVGDTSKDAWKTSLPENALKEYSESKGFAGDKLSPLTQAKGISSSGSKCVLDPDNEYGFYGSPSYLNPKSTQTSIKDSDGNYVFFQAKFEFRCINPLKTEDEAPQYFERDIYISFLEVKVDGDDKSKDITDGIRVHINQGAYTNYLIAPGYVEDKTFSLNGPLNLAGAKSEGGEEPKDQGILVSGSESSVEAKWRQYIPGYDEPSDKKTVTYGTFQDATESCLGTGSAVSTFTDGKLTDEKIKIGKTKADGTPIPVVLTIWLEGWDPCVVNKNINAEFKFGIQFEVETL